MDYKQVNDYEVISMIRENDDDARDIMYQKYLPVIRKGASKYFFDVKKHGVEFDDLVQEGWIALDSAIKSYRESYDVLFYTFAKYCIDNHLYNYCKRLNNKKNYVLDNADFDCDLTETKDFKVGSSFLEEMISEETFKQMKYLFNIKDSAVLELRYNGFSYNEISSLLDIPLSNVDGRLYKIRKYLQSYYKNWY